MGARAHFGAVKLWSREALKPYASVSGVSNFVDRQSVTRGRSYGWWDPHLETIGPKVGFVLQPCQLHHVLESKRESASAV